MPIYDGAKGKLTLEESNAIAHTLMKHLFDVPNTTHEPTAPETKPKPDAPQRLAL
jgi:hypothetical protein